MKKIIQRVCSCVVFVALLVIAISKCASILEHKYARNKYTPFYESKTNFDVLFLGTSHMWNNVLPMELWDKYGISSYNWGYSNCTPAENYYLIQDILKYTSPKVVVLDVYGVIEYEGNENGKYKDGRIEQQHVQFDSLPLSKNKIDAAKDIFDNYEHNEDFLWNFIMYHNRWSELNKSDFEPELTTEKGANFLTDLGTATFNQISEEEKTEIDSVCYPYYLKTIEYCEQQGIEVLCAYVPFAAGKTEQRVANTIGDIVEAYPNCNYVNMLTKNILNFDTDIYLDGTHSNYSGALKTTTWLGEYLSSNYELVDYSKDDSWNKDYEAYYNYKVDTLKEQTSLANYLVQLVDDDFVVEAEIYDKDLLTLEPLSALYKNADIHPILSSSDEGYSAKLIIKSSDTGELVDEVFFTNENTKETDMSNVKKVIVE